MMNNIKNTSNHHWGRFAVVLSVLGAVVFYLWQPVSDYFLTGNFDQNLAILVETENLPINSRESLLVIHTKVLNKGNVPVELLGSKGKGELVVEVRKLDQLKTGSWSDTETLQLIASKNLLERHKGTYVLEPNGIFDEVETIPLSNGMYWIKSTLIYPDGDYIDHVAVVKMESEKRNDK